MGLLFVVFIMVVSSRLTEVMTGLWLHGVIILSKVISHSSIDRDDERSVVTRSYYPQYGHLTLVD